MRGYQAQAALLASARFVYGCFSFGDSPRHKRPSSLFHQPIHERARRKEKEKGIGNDVRGSSSEWRTCQSRSSSNQVSPFSTTNAAPKRIPTPHTKHSH